MLKVTLLEDPLLWTLLRFKHLNSVTVSCYIIKTILLVHNDS